MDPTTEIPTAATSTPAPAPGATASAIAQRRDTGHPLIWTALLVWLSVEAIGDGLLALQTVLTTAPASRSKPPTVTPS
ncbi:MAG: hypothetical protein ACKO5M_08875 [Vulcanococcus sp.]